MGVLVCYYFVFVFFGFWGVVRLCFGGGAGVCLRFFFRLLHNSRICFLFLFFVGIFCFFVTGYLSTI